MLLPHPHVRIFAARLLAGLAALALVSCHGRDERSIRVAMIGAPASPFETGARLSPAAQLVRGATVEGLVALDEEGHVVPALADRWIVTDDGQSFIFRLRDGGWGSGTASGETARTALIEAIAALRGTPLGLDLDGIEDVRVMAGRVLEIRLSHPVPDLLQLLAQPELGLTRRGRAASPMGLRRTGTVAQLTPLPPEQRGLPAIDGWSDTVRSVRFTATDSDHALADFAAGKLDIVLGGSFADLPRVNRLAIGRVHPLLDPVTGLFGLQVTQAEGLLSTPAVREAIARAIDRDALGVALGIPGWQGTTRIVAPGAEGDSGQVDERWQGVPIASRQADAARVVAGWLRGHGPAPALRVALPRGPGADTLFARLQADLGTIGIRLDRVDESAPADLRLLDVVARSARPAWFLDQLACVARRGACSDAADNLARRAATAADAGVAADLAAQAEATLTQANVFIPLGLPIRWSLVSADSSGFAVNRRGVHPLFRLATGGS